MTALEALRADVEAEWPGTPYMLFESTSLDTGEPQVGVILRDDEAELIDAHCEECRDEVLPFGCLGPSAELPRYLMVYVGPTKFARIQAGWRESTGMDLRRVRFA